MIKEGKVYCLSCDKVIGIIKSDTKVKCVSCEAGIEPNDVLIYEKEYEQFKIWWDKITDKSDKWTSLERMVAHDAWMEAKAVFK